jgi:hypothetical protein
MSSDGRPAGSRTRSKSRSSGRRGAAVDVDVVGWWRWWGGKRRHTHTHTHNADRDEELGSANRGTAQRRQDRELQDREGPQQRRQRRQHGKSQRPRQRERERRDMETWLSHGASQSSPTGWPRWPVVCLLISTGLSSHSMSVGESTLLSTPLGRGARHGRRRQCRRRRRLLRIGAGDGAIGIQEMAGRPLAVCLGSRITTPRYGARGRSSAGRAVLAIHPSEEQRLSRLSTLAASPLSRGDIREPPWANGTATAQEPTAAIVTTAARSSSQSSSSPRGRLRKVAPPPAADPEC